MLRSLAKRVLRFLIPHTPFVHYPALLTSTALNECPLVSRPTFLNCARLYRSLADRPRAVVRRGQFAAKIETLAPETQRHPALRSPCACCTSIATGGSHTHCRSNCLLHTHSVRSLRRRSTKHVAVGGTSKYDLSLSDKTSNE